MGLSKEILRPTETRMTFPPVNPNYSERKVNIFPEKKAGVEARIRELSQMLFAERKKDEELEGQPREKTPQTDGFEPFVNPEPISNPIFINGYTGNFAQRMELNRKGVEKVLKIAHLDGKVVLVSMPSSRTRSVDANPDGTVTGKRNLFWGEKIENDEENPLRQVIATPQGWRIEINDTRIREELEKKNPTGKKLQAEFTKHFNEQLKQGLLESIQREKLSSEKDEHFKGKLLYATLLPILTQVVAGAPIFINHPFRATLFGVGSTILSYIVFNLFGELRKGEMRNIENILKELDPNFNPRKFSVYRHTDSLFEDLMPQIEIDKVARTWIFLSLKGRTLVKEIS